MEVGGGHDKAFRVQEFMNRWIIVRYQCTSFSQKKMTVLCGLYQHFLWTF